jgi:predicted transcriptional regulator
MNPIVPHHGNHEYNPSEIGNSSDDQEEIEEINGSQLDPSMKKPNDLLNQFKSLTEDSQRKALEVAVRVIKVQSTTLDRLEKQTEEMHSSLDSIGQMLKSWDEPGGPLDPERLKAAQENTRRHREETAQSKKYLDELDERDRKKEEVRQARWDRFKYIVALGWLYDGARLAKDIAYDNRDTVLKITLVAASVFFLALASDNCELIIRYGSLLFTTALGAFTGTTMRKYNHLNTYPELSSKE